VWTTCCVFDDLDQGAVGRILLGLAADLNRLEPAVHPRCKDAGGAVRERVERRLELVQRLSRGHGHRGLRLERNDHRKRGEFGRVDQMGAAVDAGAVDLAIEHHHLSVHAVEGAQAEVAMAEDLADGDRAVIAAGQQAGNGGYLIGLGGVRGQAGNSEQRKRKHAPKHAANHRKLLVKGRAT